MTKATKILQTIILLVILALPFQKVKANMNDWTQTAVGGSANYNESEVYTITFNEDGSGCAASAVHSYIGLYDNTDSVLVYTNTDLGDYFNAGATELTRTIQTFTGNYIKTDGDYAHTYKLVNVLQDTDNVQCDMNFVGDNIDVTEWTPQDYQQNEVSGNVLISTLYLSDHDYSGHSTSRIELCTADDDCYASDNQDADYAEHNYTFSEIPEGVYTKAEFYVGGGESNFFETDLEGFSGFTIGTTTEEAFVVDERFYPIYFGIATVIFLATFIIVLKA